MQIDHMNATEPARGESSDSAYELSVLPETSPDAGFPEPAGFYEFEGIKAELDKVNARLDAIQAMLADHAPPEVKDDARGLRHE